MKGFEHINVVGSLVYDDVKTETINLGDGVEREYTILCYQGIEVMFLFWNNEQGVYYIASYDDLYYPVNVSFNLNGELVTVTIDACLFTPIANLKGTSVKYNDVTYTIVGVYVDENFSQPVDSDALFTDYDTTNGNETYYVIVREKRS